MEKTKTRKIYLNNEELLKDLREYKEARLKAIAEGNPEPQIPNRLGAAIILIANKLAHHKSFCNYTYLEDMVGDGIENCIRCLRNFDPDKSSNPFAYFTTILWYAYVRVIKKEKKHSIIKNQLIKNSGVLELLFEKQKGDDSTYFNDYVNYLKDFVFSEDANGGTNETGSNN